MCRTSLRTSVFVVLFFPWSQGESPPEKTASNMQELAQEIQKHAPKGLSHILLTHDDFVPWK